jgi:hypothetical protein
MSISATGTYMSNDAIVAWMESKTDGEYANMKDAMSGADTQSDAETALNKISSDLANYKTNGGDASAIHDEVNLALAEYKDVPGVTDVLQPMADTLNKAFGTSEPLNGRQIPFSLATLNQSYTAAPQVGHTVVAYTGTASAPGQQPTLAQAMSASQAPAPVKISSDQVDTWTKNIGNTVDDLGRKDQLSMINIQEYNSEINQSKQTASALIDSADKSSNDIISHIG